MCQQLKELREFIVSDEFPEDARIGIVMHDNPDPDAIASALGMSRILKSWRPNLKCIYLHGGDINRSQNKTMVNVLNITLSTMPPAPAEEIQGLAEYFITVDVMPERCLPENVNCLLAVDHHKVETQRAKWSDIRLMGATASIIWDYFQQEGIELDPQKDDDVTIATALVAGIRTDTNEMNTENVTDLDFEAYKHLMSLVNRKHLSVIMDYPISPNVLKLRSQLDKEENVREENGVFVGGVGFIPESQREALPMLAQERARIEGIETAFVFAIVNDNIEVSVRSVGVSFDVPSLCKKIFSAGKNGTYGGGKMGAAAAKVPMDFLAVGNASPESQQKMYDAVKSLLMERIFSIMSETV